MATLEGIRALCARYRVQRLDVFGSVLTDRFDFERSDVDLLVAFEELPPAAYAAAYFGFKLALEALLARDVDLVTVNSLKNPWFQREIEAHRRQLYPAA